MSEAIMRLDDYDTQERFDATVVSSERITAKNSTEEVRELVLDVEHPALTYEIGQSIGR